MNSALIKRLRKIATLEAEDYGAEPQDHSSWQSADLIERQAAQIEMMREALGHALNGLLYYHHAKLVKRGIDVANEALSATPDQALEQFAERVRNQCADVCADTEPVFDGYGYQCAIAIRAIKELP